jgi:hypothetical protein
MTSADHDGRRRDTRSVATSLVWAIIIVAVAFTGGTWLSEGRQFPWHLFVAAIVVPLALVMDSQGRGGGLYSNILIFVLGVLMWWVVIEGGRRLWRRWRQANRLS